MTASSLLSPWFPVQILQWYRENGRHLPWRDSRDPYLIWLTEIIFQQTRIDQGLPYYLRFLERYPDVFTLANSPDDEVMKLWEGLGYYNRARNLLESAREIAFNKKGQFPHNYDQWLTIKGVGDYTAAIIASVCFSEVQAAIDGNVFRVLSRFYADPTPVDSSRAKPYFKSLAMALIDQESPGDFNQAMMDLGSLICRPVAPSCSVCPLHSRCSAFHKSDQNRYPVRMKKKVVTPRYLNYFIISSPEGVYLRKRRSTDIWPDLYEFVLIEGQMEASDLLSEIRDITQMGIGKLPEYEQVTHLLSHQKLFIRIYRIPTGLNPDGGLTGGYEPVKMAQIQKLAFPKPLQKFI